jgi:plasmid stabilization system protein ParE
MRLEFHPAVQRDVNRTLGYFRREGGPALEERFFKAMMDTLRAISSHPERCSPYPPNPYFRRAFIKKFHHICVFRMKGNLPRITVLKHERRHPNGAWTGGDLQVVGHSFYPRMIRLADVSCASSLNLPAFFRCHAPSSSPRSTHPSRLPHHDG